MTKYIASLLALLTLTACSQKPPGCADPETLSTIRNLVVEDTRKLMSKQAADDPEGWVQRFLDGLRVEVSGIVSDGYVADAKKHLCRGTMKFTTVTGAALERQVRYSTQKAQDQKDSFLLEVQEFAAFLAPTELEATKYHDANRWSGNWTGTYACSGVAGATEGPQGPYSMPVTMVVEGTKATLERTTKGGGIEQLEGRFDPIAFTEQFMLIGEGKNSPDDAWVARFSGAAKGLQLTAKGSILVDRVAASGEQVREVARTCNLELKLAR